MMIDSGLAEVHVQRAVTVTTAVCGLPAVATQDWCDDAAASLVGVRSGGLVAVTIGVLGSQGEFSMVEASGCSDRDRSFVVRPEHSTALGWWLPERGTPGVRTALLRDLPTARVWAGTDPGMRWARYGMRDLIVGLAPMGGTPGRCLAVEIGIPGERGIPEAADAIVLRGVLAPLARRALVAFGAQPSATGNRLTPREQQVLEHLALGKSVKQIADELGRSAHTVHDHVKSLHRKLNASSRGELIARALGHIEACARDRVDVHVESRSAREFLDASVPDTASRALAS
ncbi:MAG: response regulator transcription factor [Phycisphaerales bacterium]|nr:response regulator transcription factor [Phycisphaerales bacterium]